MALWMQLAKVQKTLLMLGWRRSNRRRQEEEEKHPLSPEEALEKRLLEDWASDWTPRFEAMAEQAEQEEIDRQKEILGFCAGAVDYFFFLISFGFFLSMSFESS